MKYIGGLDMARIERIPLNIYLNTAFSKLEKDEFEYPAERTELLSELQTVIHAALKKIKLSQFEVIFEDCTDDYRFMFDIQER